MSRDADKGAALRTIGVVIPAHNEEELIADCLRAVDAAAREPSLADVAVHIVVGGDACPDRPGAVLASPGPAPPLRTPRPAPAPRRVPALRPTSHPLPRVP